MIVSLYSFGVRECLQLSPKCAQVKQLVGGLG